jgi:hypothetical protein
MVARTTLASAVAAWALAATPAAAAQQNQLCATQALVVDAAAVTVVLCAPPGAAAGDDGLVHLPLSETISTKTASFERTTELDFLPGGEVSRSIDDVPLARLGFGKEEALHLTIAHTPSSLRLEHVLLLPEAVPLK